MVATRFHTTSIGARVVALAAAVRRPLSCTIWFMNQMVQTPDVEGKSAKHKMVRAMMAEIMANGLGDRSLRDLASAIGSSHRMVLYHFGSFEGLLVAIVQQFEADEMEALAEQAARDLDRPALLRAAWKRHRAPEMAGAHRLFFELYGQALGGRAGTEAFLDTAVIPWLEASTAVLRSQGVKAADARAQARLDLAVIRGLILDVRTTGDIAGTTRALERYLSA